MEIHSSWLALDVSLHDLLRVKIISSWASFFFYTYIIAALL